MKTAECQEHLANALAGCRSAVPEGTLLDREASSVLLMARSYESDGRKFAAGGDPVNALASCYYAFGWLHFGISCGLLAAHGKPSPCIFAGEPEDLLVSAQEKLREKTARYARLLAAARSSVRPAAEEGTPARTGAERVLSITAVYAGFGDRHHAEGRNCPALACYSYGHGWLDAAVVCGFFLIESHREIFTV